MKLKEILLKNKVIWNINSKIKARQVEKKYKKIVNEYSKKRQKSSIKDLLTKKGWNNFKWKNLRIIYLGTDPLQDFGGFNQALNELCDLKLFYKEDGTYGQYFGEKADEKNLERLKYLLKEYEIKEGWIPDILMMQSFGETINNAKIIKLKEKYKFKVVNIGMDERLAYRQGKKREKEQGISGLNSIVDLVLVTTPECVDWYLKEEIPAFYFPLASNEKFYFPIKKTEKKYDVGFIGRKYGLRQEIVEYLIKNGINVKTYGPGWANGTLDVKENNEFYNSCKIVLGTGNIGYSKKLMNPKLRDFEVPLTGTLYITNYTKELTELFETDKEIVLYKTKKELLRKIKYYLENEKERNKVGENGLNKSKKMHTYEGRLEKFMNLEDYKWN